MPKGQSWCGEPVGILVLDETIPRVLGSVLNAETFSFPVRYKKIKEAHVKQLLYHKDPSLLKPFIEAAQELEMEGVNSIVGSCGFMALFQREIVNAVNIPVAMSSLLQLPMLLRMINSHKKVGIITASKKSLTTQILLATGISEEEINTRLTIVGLDNCPEAQGAMLEEKGTLDEDKFRHEVLETTEELLGMEPALGAILMECSELPPYSANVQKISGLPVFDFVTMIKFNYMGVRAHSWQRN